MWRMHPTESTVFLKFKFVGCTFFVFGCCIISSFACTTCKSNNISHLHPSNEKNRSTILQIERLFIEVSIKQ
jgi:hypothetical protein